MKIILDAMGGDLAPEAPVLGAIDAAKDFGAEITLVGRSEEILEVMRKNGYNDLPKGVEIAGADDVVDMHDDPATVRIPTMTPEEISELVNVAADHK